MRGLLRSRAASAPLRRRGLSFILLGFVLILLVVFVSFGVDVGRIRLARAQLQTAADSSARFGARGLPTSSDTVIDNAVDAAASNPVIDSETSNAAHMGGRTNPGVELYEDDDIHFGTWDTATRTFTEITDKANTEQDERRFANAVKTEARAIEERNNPIPLVFAPVLGVMHSNIERPATAYITGGPANFGFIGIDWVKSNGNGATIYNESGALASGGVASDGDVDLGNGDVYGDARPGIGDDLVQGPNSVVTGWGAPLDYQLKPLFPPYTMADTTNATTLEPQKNQPLVIQGGPESSPREYLVNGKLDHPDPIQINNGYVIIYVNGDVDVQGSQILNAPAPNVAARLEIRVIGNRNIDLGGTSQQYMHLYAPTSDVTVHGTVAYHGWIVGKTLTFKGTTDLYYDGTNQIDGKYLIRLVE